MKPAPEARGFAGRVALSANGWRGLHEPPIFSLFKQRNRRASDLDQTRWLQVIRRSHAFPGSGPASRRGRTERVRQVQHHRRRALGARRIARLRTARRVDAGRDLQWLDRAQARQPRQRRTGVRQRRRPGRGPVGPVCRNRRQARAHARRHLELLHQQFAGASPRHSGHLPRHRSRAARLRDHRAGHDRAPDRGEAGRAARVPRRSRGCVEVQGTPPRNRKPSARHARKSDTGRGHRP
jgi:hypothetical protein